MRIDVTQEDIERGQRRVASACPIALATARTLWPDGKGDRFVRVGVGFISMYSSPSEIHRPLGVAKIPQEARDFIDRFDADKDVEPFGFDVEY